MSQDDNDDSQHVKETREVENVGPEKNTTRGTRPKGETQQPPERGLIAPLEPRRLFDFGGDRDQEADKYGGRDN